MYPSLKVSTNPGPLQDAPAALAADGIVCEHPIATALSHRRDKLRLIRRDEEEGRRIVIFEMLENVVVGDSNRLDQGALIPLVDLVGAAIVDTDDMPTGEVLRCKIVGLGANVILDGYVRHHLVGGIYG